MKKILLILLAALNSFAYLEYESLNNALSRVDSFSNIKRCSWPIIIGSEEYWIKQSMLRWEKESFCFEMFDGDTSIAVVKITDNIVDISGQSEERDGREIYPATLPYSVFISLIAKYESISHFMYITTCIDSLWFIASCRVSSFGLYTCDHEKANIKSVNPDTLSLVQEAIYFPATISVKYINGKEMKFSGGLISGNWLYSEYNMCPLFSPIREYGHYIKYVSKKDSEFNDTYTVFSSYHKIAKIVNNGKRTLLSIDGRKYDLVSYGTRSLAPKLLIINGKYKVKKAKLNNPDYKKYYHFDNYDSIFVDNNVVPFKKLSESSIDFNGECLKGLLNNRPILICNDYSGVK